ncbi:hypothetical protein Goe27_01180 [Bacillus phage vB_BsuM-Goe27]|nr:hypothetical protein Goe17_01220 [Bacillus phage vB_BsuM-Goe17]WCS69996.1 hypothetical protein Goe27_01180 [Bacillus phage vB_BsuM-Goe27]
MWGDGYEYVSIEELKGKVLEEVRDTGYDELYFYTVDGDTYRMNHEQDCCEHVELEDIIGDLDDLIGEPILMAEEVTEEEPAHAYEGDASETWTFYKLATIKGYVTLRWYGTSNGYYSESVSFKKFVGEGNDE